jgi:hypothetical protein
MPTIAIDQRFLEQVNLLRHPQGGSVAFVGLDEVSKGYLPVINYSTDFALNKEAGISATLGDFHRRPYVRVSDLHGEQEEFFWGRPENFSGDSAAETLFKHFKQRYFQSDADLSSKLDPKLQEFILTYWNQGGFSDDARSWSNWLGQHKADAQGKTFIHKDGSHYIFIDFKDSTTASYTQISDQNSFKILSDSDSLHVVDCNLQVESKATLGLNEEGNPYYKLEQYLFHFKKQKDLDNFLRHYNINENKIKGERRLTRYQKLYAAFKNIVEMIYSFFAQLMTWLFKAKKPSFKCSGLTHADDQESRKHTKENKSSFEDSILNIGNLLNYHYDKKSDEYRSVNENIAQRVVDFNNKSHSASSKNPKV